jgi:hypothetical protein
MNAITATLTKTAQTVTILRMAIREGHRYTMADQCAMARDDRAARAVCIQAALILEGKRPILTTKQTKLDKAQGDITGYVNRGLTLATSREASPFIGSAFDACIGATDACRLACVGSRTGQGRLPSSAIARIGRTIALHVDPVTFWARYDREVQREQRRAERKGYRLAMRCNVASDHAHVAARSAATHPDVAHYDYTAIAANVRRVDGVRRVYSLKDGAQRRMLAKRMIDEGRGVAVVFAASARRKEPLPATWNGAPVIDGDLHDLWFLQAPETGPFVVGLRVKGDNGQVQAAIDAGFAVAV